MSRDDFSVRRRSLLAGSAAALGGSALFGTNTRSALATTQAAGTEPDTADGTIEPLEFWFGDSLTNPDGEPLEDDSLVAVSAEPTASLDTGEDYDADTAIPLVAIDDQNVEGTVVGMGSSLVRDGTNWEYGNEEFMLNLLDTTTEDADEVQTVFFNEVDYDELGNYGKFRNYATAAGYEFVSHDDIVDVRGSKGLTPALLAAEDPAALILPSFWNPKNPIPTEREAVADYVASGGVLILQHHNEFGARALKKNSLLEQLGVGFRFNEALVQDAVHNSRGLAQTLTAQFNTDAYPELFADRPGLDPDDVDYGYVSRVEQYVKDGDTISIYKPDGGTKEVRLLGLDAAESGENACFERPEEWTGIAHDKENYIGDGSRIHYPEACSLRTPGGRLPIGRVILQGEASASQIRSQGEGESPGFVAYDGAPPVVAAEDGVVGVGAPLVDDDSLSESNENADFLLNLWDDKLAGGATVLYDESHGQARSLDDFETFLGEVPGHYTVETTEDLAADLESADAVWLDAPREPFTDAERDALSAFLQARGVVFAHGEAAAEDSTPIKQLNGLAAAVGRGVRFNPDRLEDTEANAGEPSRPRTANLRGRDAEPFPNRYDNIRFANRGGYYQGCGEGYRPDLTHWASLAGSYLENRVKDDSGSTKRVRWVPDPNQTMEDGLGRLLGYIYYDSTGDGSYDRNVCLELIEEGLARTYHSAHVLHDEFLTAELNARAAEKGMWAQHDLESVPERRNRPVERVFVPQATSIRTASGRLSAERAPITAESTATQDGDTTVKYEESIPLVGVDKRANVAVVGGAMLEECYEIREDGYRNLDFVNDADPFRVNTAAFDHYTFLTNLIDRLADDDRQGDAVVVDGGHGQFASPSDQFDAKTAQSAEETAYYKRFLEGLDGTELYGLNGFERNPDGDLLDVQALLISSPMWGYSDEQLDAVSEFADRGGAVVLMGSGRAPNAARQNLNEVADAVDTDLRINDDRILDSEHTVRGIEDLVYTGAIDAAPALLNPARASGPDRGPPGQSDGGIDDPDDFEISGFRETNVPTVEEPAFGSKTSAVREGEEVRISITIEDLNHPAGIRLPLGFLTARDWDILQEGTDVEKWDPARQEVFLGEVAPEDVAGDQTVTKQVFAIAGYTARPESAVGSTNVANVFAQEPRYGIPSGLALASMDGQLARRYLGSRETIEPPTRGPIQKNSRIKVYVIPRDA